MKNKIINTNIGYCFSDVAEKAKNIATDIQKVEFNFNGIKCVISKTTNLELLERDYENAHLMKWKKIGHECLEEYPLELRNRIQKRTEKLEEEHKKQVSKWLEEEKIKKEALESKIKDIEFNCRNEEAFKVWEDSNKDSYGLGVINYAKYWAKLMQYEIDKGANLIDIASQTSFDADVEGITGFMYGYAINILSECWVYGEELRIWHNQKYNHSGEGVVNPAILTIG